MLSLCVILSELPELKKDPGRAVYCSVWNLLESVFFFFSFHESPREGEAGGRTQLTLAQLVLVYLEAPGAGL